MTRLTRSIGFLALTAGLVWPVSGVAQPQNRSNPGGKAAEHRSERAAERSNAQWERDAEKRRDRSEEMRSEGEANVDRAQKPKRVHSEGDAEDEPKDKSDRDDAAKRERREAGQERRQKAAEQADGATEQPGDATEKRENRSRSFWQRWFGDGEPDED